MIEARTPSEVFCEEWQWGPSDLLDTLQGKMVMGLQIEWVLDLQGFPSHGDNSTDLNIPFFL